MPRIAKVDANQPEIVKALRDAGAEVQHLHMVGQGCPDIIVGVKGVTVVGITREDLLSIIEYFDTKYLVHCSIRDEIVVHDGANILVEIKDGSKVPSKRRLTEDEEKWHEKWTGQVIIWESVDDALKGIGLLRQSPPQE